MGKYWPGILTVLIVLAVAIPFSFGMRINFDALQRHTNKAPFMQVQLKNGKTLVGKFVKESAEGLTLDMGGGDMTLTLAEIGSRKELSAEEVQSGDYSAWMGSTKDPDIVTFREQDNLWIQWGMMKASPKPKLTLAPMPKLKPKSTQGETPRSEKKSSVSGSETGAEGQPVKVATGSMLDIYKKAMSPESLDAYKKQTIDELNSAPRNPFVEVAKAAQLANTKAVANAESAEENIGDFTQS